jgi:hypothetical protein
MIFTNHDSSMTKTIFHLFIICLFWSDGIRMLNIFLGDKICCHAHFMLE